MIDEDIHGFLVSDELRKSLASNDDKIFSREEQQEFLFHVFKSLSLGGWICQYEDTLEQSLEATKLVYKVKICVFMGKDLISVRKGNHGKLHVSSRVFKVTGFDEVEKSPLFASDHVQNFCFVSVKGIGGIGPRVVDVWYHSYA